MVLTGFRSLAECRALRHVAPDLVLAVDYESHTRAYATAQAPFSIRSPDGWRHLGMGALNEVLDGQIYNGASFAVTPTTFLGYEDGSPVLRSVIAAANRLERDDTVVLVACSYKWLQRPALAEFAEQLAACRHPVALTLQADSDPMERRGVPEGLRQLCRACPDLVLWRTDLAAFDAMTHGALAGAVGVTAGLRHAVDPAREGPGGGRNPFTVVLLGRLLRYFRVTTLQDWFAHSDPWACDCAVCRGAALDRFTDKAADVLQAHQHSIRQLYLLHQDMAASHRGHHRLEWWRQTLGDSYELHRQLSRQIEMEIDFPKVLQAWRRPTPMPLAPVQRRQEPI
jgi:hypothetical protein